MTESTLSVLHALGKMGADAAAGVLGQVWTWTGCVGSVCAAGRLWAGIQTQLAPEQPACAGQAEGRRQQRVCHFCKFARHASAVVASDAS